MVNESFLDEFQKLASLSVAGKMLSGLGAVGGGARGAVRGISNMARGKGNIESAVRAVRGGASSGWRSSKAYNLAGPLSKRTKKLQKRVGANQLIGGAITGAAAANLMGQKVY